MRSWAVDRGSQSFFADTKQSAAALTMCTGLSCALAGSEKFVAISKTDAHVRDARCLGYCDRSPVMLSADGRIICGQDNIKSALHAGLSKHLVVESTVLPRIRCAAREAIVTKRVATGDFAKISRAIAAGVYGALILALEKRPIDILNEVEKSEEQGRGGAGFSTGRKWRMCAEANGQTKYVIANGDEGDPGSFIDRVLLENDPHTIIEGLVLCGYAVGATGGFIYIRSEYPEAYRRVVDAVRDAEREGFLGTSICDSEFSFRIKVVSGRGSYVCGEETALLNAIEGRRGEVRFRPPYPTDSGLHGCPTVVNNVETLANIPWILHHGSRAFRDLGTRSSPGTKAFCFNAGFAQPGIVEVEFGMSLAEVVDLGGGLADRSGQLAGIALGGPMGSILTCDELEVPVDYNELNDRGIRLGHGGVVAISSEHNARDMLVHWLTFMVEESCGKCAPCAFGSQEALRLAQIIHADDATELHVNNLLRLLNTIRSTSLCGFGQNLPGPLLTLLVESAAPNESFK
jgi:NADH-quinone oxidoreductase subunit F